LIDEKGVPAAEVFGAFTNPIGEIDGFLVDEQFLEAEGRERRRLSNVMGAGISRIRR
jgi:hypothetical protein